MRGKGKLRLLYNPNSKCRCSGGVGKSFYNHCSQDKYSPELSRNAKSGGEQLEETQDICMILSVSLKRKKKRVSPQTVRKQKQQLNKWL